MKKLLVPVLLASVWMVSCNKEKNGSGNNGGTPGKSKYEILTSGKWKVTELMLDPSTSPDNINLMDGMDACQTDNLYAFNANGSITMDEGAAKCNAGDSQTRTDGSWVVNADTSRIVLLETSITMGNGDLAAEIATLNESTLKLKKDTSIVIVPGSTPLTGVFYATFTKVN